ncbi:MAG: ATP phosphoribosyltransferase regulatory subunit [Clostridia bacterium]|nr:ATP phosphoribosyltransferase regulatory subunit [Clostridia bacterium]
MKSTESKIPQFYDISDEELHAVNTVYRKILEKAKIYGYDEIQTSSFELKDRYLSATNVHPSKIFEAVRPKQRTTFLLASDLAMSISRFIADLPTIPPVVKLIQLNNLFRDRIPEISGYRREFKQVLLGVWGSPSFFYDAELIDITYRSLQEIQGIQLNYLQISNHDIFNAVSPGLAQEIRFNGIEKLIESDLSSSDKAILLSLFHQGTVPITEFFDIASNIKNEEIQKEVEKVKTVYHYLHTLQFPGKILFSLSNFGGTGHYTGMNYRIYANLREEKGVLIADGGRINNLCQKFNPTKEIDAVCMGIGIQVIAQKLFFAQKEKVLLILPEKELNQAMYQILIIRKILSDYRVSILPLPTLERKKQFFQSPFYQNCCFIFYEKEHIEVRSDNPEQKATIEKLLCTFL